MSKNFFTASFAEMTAKAETEIENLVNNFNTGVKKEIDHSFFEAKDNFGHIISALKKAQDKDKTFFPPEVIGDVCFLLNDKDYPREKERAFSRIKENIISEMSDERLELLLRYVIRYGNSESDLDEDRVDILKLILGPVGEETKSHVLNSVDKYYGKTPLDLLQEKHPGNVLSISYLIDKGAVKGSELNARFSSLEISTTDAEESKGEAGPSLAVPSFGEAFGGAGSEYNEGKIPEVNVEANYYNQVEGSKKRKARDSGVA